MTKLETFKLVLISQEPDFAKYVKFDPCEKHEQKFFKDIIVSCLIKVKF